MSTAAAERRLTRLSVEYNLTEHCNLSCYGCDHASPLMPTKFAAIRDFVRDFESLAPVFHSQQFRLVGGEPTLHPSLLDFIAEARRIGFADSIVLITNGVLLHQMPPELWNSIDQLWISAYPGVKRRLGDEECARLCEAHGIRLQIWHANEFNRTLINTRVENQELVGKVFQECKMAGEFSCHTVHEGRFYRCSIAPFMASRLAMRGIAFANREIDGVALHDNPNLYQDIERCLNGQTPLAACSYCLGTSGPFVAHHQLNFVGRRQWLEEDNTQDIAMVSARLLGSR